jgi:hypothetical protein
LARAATVSISTLVYQREGAAFHRAWEWLNSKGGREPLMPEAGGYQQPTFSPDGRRLAFLPRLKNMDLRLDIRTRVTSDFGKSPVERGRSMWGIELSSSDSAQGLRSTVKAAEEPLPILVLITPDPRVAQLLWG